MVDSNIITVTTNDNPMIQVEITNYKNCTDVSFIQSKGDKGDVGNVEIGRAHV